MFQIWKAFFEETCGEDPFAEPQRQRLQHIANQPFITPLAEIGLLQCQGPDSQTFLQGQLSCDVRKVTPQKSQLACYCNHKGRVLATLILRSWQGSFWLQLPCDLTKDIQQELNQFALFSKVELKNKSSQLLHLGIAGQGIDDVLSAYFSILPSEHYAMVTENNIHCMKLPGPLPRYQLSAYGDELFMLTAKLQQLCQLQHPMVWRLLDIHVGIPTVTKPCVALFTPQQLNYIELDGVSFDKGCYRGQEIVARMHYRGQAKQQLYQGQLLLDREPAVAETLVTEANEQIGYIVNYGLDPHQGWQVLAVLNKAQVKSNKLLLTGNKQLLL